MARLPAHRRTTAAPTCETGIVSDLLTRCGRGDQAAFARLFHLAFPAVRAAVAARVEPAAVEDWVTATFVTVWRNAPGYAPGRTPAVDWLMEQVQRTAGAQPRGQSGPAATCA
ncbi:MAG: hypothetical protein ACXVXG_11850 [Nocardioidaceae bacterium]